jgi:hypothetical protein
LSFNNAGYGFPDYLVVAWIGIECQRHPSLLSKTHFGRIRFHEDDYNTTPKRHSLIRVGATS